MFIVDISCILNVSLVMIESSGACTCNIGEELLNEDCSLCDSQSFKTWIGDGPCDSCPSGTTSSQDRIKCDCNLGSSFIVEQCVCIPGFEPNSQTGECDECPLHSFKNKTSDTECSSCETIIIGSVTNDTGLISSSSCHCPEKEYESNEECLSCPEGVNCEEGTTIENMEVEDGYWRVDGESDTILQCPVVKACIGSSSDSYGDNLCRKGHEGPYCSVCIDGYFKGV